MSESAIAQTCAEFGLDPAPGIEANILKLKEFLKFHGRAANLTSRLDDASLDQHVIEALMLAALAQRLQVRGRWLDIGSGGGFPGLVLALALPDVELTLVEPRAKRATVLELGLRKLGRSDCHVLRGRVDRGRWLALEGGPPLQAGFDAASARAVFDPERWALEGAPWLRPGGLLFVHLPIASAAPKGLLERGRLEHGKWAIVAGDCST